MKNSIWTEEDIESILLQLNNQNLPFKKYDLSRNGAGIHRIGSGATANVYEAVSRSGGKKEYAVKVLGFGEKHMEPDSFENVVSAQSDLAISGNVVKIDAYAQLLVWLEGDNKVVKALRAEDAKDSDFEENAEKSGRRKNRYIRLQFVVMEKLIPVIQKDGSTYRIWPPRLAACYKDEILKLAYDIGLALNNAHKIKMIHRDIKLENVFYDSKADCYKLGDFGIATITKDGFAHTTVFSKGYGAPEVVATLDDDYDYTADIYSFGMLLYLLLNNIRFPESVNYHPNVFQYFQGYKAPEPVNGFGQLTAIVMKMIQYNPDDRYQSVEEILNDLESLSYGESAGYQRRHRKAELIFGSAFAFMGAALWKLSFAENMTFDYSIWMYILCGLGILKSILFVAEKKTSTVSCLMFVAGIILTFSTGFTWGKLLLAFIVSCLYGYLPGLAGICALIINCTDLIIRYGNLSVGDYYEYRWIAVLFISLAGFFIYDYFLMGSREKVVKSLYLGNNYIWIVMTGYFGVMFLFSFCIELVGNSPYNLYEMIFGQRILQGFMSINPGLIGTCGVIFSLVWMIRHIIMAGFVKRTQRNRAKGV